MARVIPIEELQAEPERVWLHRACGNYVGWTEKDVITDLVQDERYFICPVCNTKYTLAIGGVEPRWSTPPGNIVRKVSEPT